MPTIDGIYSAADYGAVGDGLVSSAAANTRAIQRALDAAAAGGGGTVRLGPGTFYVVMVAHPDNASYHAALMVPNRVALVGCGKATTIVKLAPNEPSNGAASIIYNRNLNGGDDGIRVSDLTLDGNGENQTKLHNGVIFLRTVNAMCERVRVINVRGTSNVPPGETFFFDTQLSTDTLYVSCEAFGTAGTHGSGFSANGATNPKWIGCTAYGMTAGLGFTANSCAEPQWIGCRAYKCGSGGFNVEESFAPLFSGCISGGKASVGPAYPYGAKEALGNTGPGFTLNGSAMAVVSGCVATDNHGGIVVAPGGASSGVSSGRITGNVLSGNGSGATFLDLATAANHRMENNDLTGNTTTAVDHPSGYISYVPGNITGLPVPGNGVVWINQYPFDVDVYLKGGAGFGVQIQGIDVSSAIEGLYRVAPNQQLRMFYSTAPSWAVRVSG